ncbi:Hint domain-containing protein [Litoreibacter janthinus]|uniref:Hint domain-containing protein n=1 Tax=Litoreibacter janthinus TaxID=670154 RepID=A0A1I6HDH9_9RHOB|nr:Hint domain-containing protein [Litoreibacter janthinus]SFR52434.1 Hint domain-containing protein [Litoreibacter janthinus]
MSRHQVYISPQSELSVSRRRALKPCFALGTHILTPLGDRLVQDLKVGDLVETLDHGAQPIRATGVRRFEALDDDAPIRFKAGTLNNEHDLCVTAGHRIRFAGWQADLLFGEWEVLVAARDFVNGVDVTRDIGGMVGYAYLGFDAHHIIFAERVPVESAQTDPKAAVSGPSKDKLAFPPLQDHEAQVLLRSYAKAKEPAKPIA